MYRQRIRESYEHLSKSQKRIADFLMISHRQAAFMTASQLAAALAVDVATITRFAQRLKYPGYPDLLDEVRSAVQTEMGKGVKPIDGMSEAVRAFVRALNTERDNIERTLSGISMDAVDKAVTALLSTQHIYVIGVHSASWLAMEMALHLRWVGREAVVVSGDSVQVAMAARTVQAGDVVMGFGFSNYAVEAAALLRMARRRGATTICVSGSDVSPVARNADIVLICVAESSLHMPSEVSAAAVIEALGQSLAATHMDEFKRGVHAFGVTYQELTAAHVHPDGPVEDSAMRMF